MNTRKIGRQRLEITPVHNQPTIPLHELGILLGCCTRSNADRRARATKVRDARGAGPSEIEIFISSSLAIACLTCILSCNAFRKPRRQRFSPTRSTLTQWLSHFMLRPSPSPTGAGVVGVGSTGAGVLSTGVTGTSPSGCEEAENMARMEISGVRTGINRESEWVCFSAKLKSSP